jgi:hypothetical protein
MPLPPSARIKRFFLIKGLRVVVNQALCPVPASKRGKIPGTAVGMREDGERGALSIDDAIAGKR